jgi:hypothetical protein
MSIETLPSPSTEIQIPTRYVRAERLLEILFEEDSRPSLRWLREQQARRAIPFVKIGALVYFDPPAVKAHFAAKSTIRGRRN